MKKNLLSIICLCLAISAFGQQTYLEYSSNCMDRYVYRAQDSKNGSDYIAYQIDLGNRQYALLEVGSENTRWTQTPPSRPSKCESFPISRKLVQDINTNKSSIFIVRKGRNGYNVSPVKKAVFYYQIGSELELTSKDAEFALNLERPVYDRDISMLGSPSEVYLDGVDFQQCSKGYIIRKTKDQRAKTYKEITFSPEVGILEKRSVTLARNSSKINVIKLTKVNDQSIENFISEKCVELQANLYDNRNKEDVVDRYGAESRRTGDSRTSTKGGPCATESVEGLHVVQGGETMYSIARRYGISLAQLRSWNGLQNSNMISPCQELYVVSPATFDSRRNTESRNSTPPGSLRISNNDTTAKSGSSNNRNRAEDNGRTSRSSSTNTTRRRSTEDRTFNEGGTPAWLVHEDLYKVRRGETVASIAEKFGFTEERFRWMNGLGERERVYTNQEVRVGDCDCEKEVRGLRKKGVHPYEEESEAIADDSNEPLRFTEFTPPPENPKNYRVHIVQSGETLYSIARDYGSSVDRIREINGFSKGEVIMRSQRIYVD